MVAALYQLVHPFLHRGVAEFNIANATFAFGDQFIKVIPPNRPDSACARDPVAPWRQRPVSRSVRVRFPERADRPWSACRSAHCIRLDK